MTLTELRYIVILSEEQHFGRTAERCHVSQPTLSIAVRKLEEELGVELFERTKTKVQPTVLGEKIVAQARVLLTTTAAIKSLADAGKDQLNSPLALGTIFTIGPYLLPQLIPHLQKQAPAMPLYVQEDYTANLRKKLRDGDLDAILVSLPFSESDVVTQELFDEPLVVVMRQTHPLASKTEIAPADIAREELLLLGEGHCLREQVLLLNPGWREPDESPRKRYAAEGNSLETLRYMVAAGLGLSVLPRSAAEAGLCAAHRLVARPLAGGQRKLALAWRASFPRHKAIDVLRKSIQSCSGAYWNFTTEPDALEQTMLPLANW
ncbi:hydrogen peroxide-inducible genes activator [Cellvibrio fibrivorans]|uniref:LysR family hydrogen peroxide-inducible transcriptional activator n=1 Tax=Cellvibrio fibrivorans TaxID=126350 RepID=A0ABU1USH6_9GAMM|nr:hydrogen peroxide-inducible genes activator [Cellvibrio fibrivorans]MDR7088140.1 LysR family hydrogen peroxide-inducible transcriptional activator [Cellvibrio fibrivorans]